jgi:hypothetical protein
VTIGGESAVRNKEEVEYQKEELRVEREIIGRHQMEQIPNSIYGVRIVMITVE